MAPRMKALACSQAEECTRTCTCLKYFEASVAVAVGGVDVDIGLLGKLGKFIEDCIYRFCCT